jgi:hypothetical protein
MAQQRLVQQAGDLIAAQEIIAILDERTRDHHAARNGKRYERQQNGSFVAADGEELPDLPDEPNCRCFASPILAGADELLADAPELGADFANAAAEVIPDPSAYSVWFDDASPSQRAAAVGVGPYRAAQGVLDVEPDWENFIGADGKLMTAKAIKGESVADRERRLAGVRKTIQGRETLLVRAGVEPTPTAGRLGKAEAETEKLRQQLAAAKAGREEKALQLQQIQQSTADTRARLAALTAQGEEYGREAADLKARIKAAEKQTKAIDRQLRKQDEAHDAMLRKQGITGYVGGAPHATEPQTRQSKAATRGESAADVKSTIATTAQEYGVDPGSLKEAFGVLREEKNEYIRSVRTAKEGLHKKTFLAPADVRKLNNAGLDYTAKEHQIVAALGDNKTSRRLATSLSQFDERATVLAREYPGNTPSSSWATPTTAVPISAAVYGIRC